MVQMKPGAGGGQAAQSMGSGWPTPGPGSPAFRWGMARQAGCAEVAVDDEHGAPSVAKPGGCFLPTLWPTGPHIIRSCCVNAEASRPACPTMLLLVCLARADRGCSRT